MIFQETDFYEGVRYPNLMAEHCAGNSIGSLALYADVSGTIMREVLLGNEDLTCREQQSMAKYMDVPIAYLFSPKLSLLYKGKNRHKVWINKLYDELYTIWEYAKAGSEDAKRFMKGEEHDDLVSIWLWFNMHDTFYNQYVTYAAYRNVRRNVDFCLREINKEKQPMFRTHRIGRLPDIVGTKCKESDVNRQRRAI